MEERVRVMSERDAARDAIGVLTAEREAAVRERSVVRFNFQVICGL